MRNFVFNEIMKLKRQTLIEMSRLLEKNELKKSLFLLPKKLLPGPEGTYRNSVYHEREVLKQRIKLFLGLDYEKSKNLELFQISEHLDEILEGKSELLDKEKKIHIIKEGCDSCPSGRYYITDLCRNCVAHSCMNSCPKDAISFENGRASINTEKCIGCGLCEQSCNYFAITKLERPCEVSCSVEAIEKDETNAAEINYDKCVTCGACYISCPFGAVETTSSLIKVLYNLKKNKKKNVALIAPSIVSQFGPKVNIGKIKNALKKIGFDDAIEVAVGADMVAKEEAEYLENNHELITTSCCPAFVEYIKKYKPEYIDKISPSLSPMTHLAKYLKKEYDNLELTFVGPCIAKEKENFFYGEVDNILTFEEIGILFITKNVEPSNCEEEDLNGSYEGWNFAASGGVTKAVKCYTDKKIKSIQMNGLIEAEKIFNELKKEDYDLLEGMACEGGCICGPGIMNNPRIAKRKLSDLNTKIK